jgi:hypothetical protein
MNARVWNLVAVCVGISMSASAAAAAPAGATAIGDGAAAISVLDQVQRCRCVERRWNGSCKLRVCRDRWGANVDSAEPADTPAPGADAEEAEDRSMNAPDRGPKKATKPR